MQLKINLPQPYLCQTRHRADLGAVDPQYDVNCGIGRSAMHSFGRHVGPIERHDSCRKQFCAVVFPEEEKIAGHGSHKKKLFTLATFSKEKSGLLTYFLTLVMSALDTLSLLKVLICKE